MLHGLLRATEKLRPLKMGGQHKPPKQKTRIQGTAPWVMGKELPVTWVMELILGMYRERCSSRSDLFSWIYRLKKVILSIFFESYDE